MKTKMFMRICQDALADDLGCGDCTMREEWRTASIQKPEECRLDNRNIFCPIYGEMPYKWDKIYKKYHYTLVDIVEE